MDDGRDGGFDEDLAALRAELDRVAAGIDLTGEFIGAGRSWSELDHDGNVVRRNVPVDDLQ